MASTDDMDPMEQFAIMAANCGRIITQAKNKINQTRELVSVNEMPDKGNSVDVIQEWITDMKERFSKIKAHYKWIGGVLAQTDIRKMMSFTPGSLEAADSQYAQIGDEIEAFRSKYSGWLKHFTGIIIQKEKKSIKKETHKSRNETNRRTKILIRQFHAAVRDNNEMAATEVLEELQTIHEYLLNSHLLAKYREIRGIVQPDVVSVKPAINFQTPCWGIAPSDPGAGPSGSSTSDVPTGPIRECLAMMVEAPHNELIKLHETHIDGRKGFCCISPDQFEPWLRMHDRTDFDAIDGKKGKKLGLRCREHGTHIDIGHIVNTLPKNPSRWIQRFGNVPCPDGWKAIRSSLFDFIKGQMIPVIRLDNMQQHEGARLCRHCPYDINGYYPGMETRLGRNIYRRLITTNKTNKTKPCLSCGRRLCTDCGHFYANGPMDPIIRPDKDHKDRPCVYMQVLETGDVETADLQAVLEDAKQCPKCGIPTHKIRDCDHMTCANPDCFSMVHGRREPTHWCYGCGDAWFKTKTETYTHMCNCAKSNWTG